MRRILDFEAAPASKSSSRAGPPDMAHDPRQEVDERPENQCEAYRSGEADHFVELDPAGNVLRVE